jgi:hypothetical protein
MMDEFAIYGTVLSLSNVRSHYNAAVNNPSNYTYYENAVSANAPLLWLKLDDANMNTWAPAANSGSVAGINGMYRKTSSLLYGTFLRETGITSDSYGVHFPVPSPTGNQGAWIEVDDSGGQFSTIPNGNVTIELWVDCNSNDINNSNTLLFQHNGSNSYTLTGGYGLEVNGPAGNILGIIGGGQIDYVNLPYAISDSNWHHIVVTYDSNYVPVPGPNVGTYPTEVLKDNPVLYLRFEGVQPKDFSAADGNHWVGYGGAASIVNKVGGIGNSVYLNWPSGSSSGLEGVYGVAATNNPNLPPEVNSTYEVYGYKYAFAPNSITFELWMKSLLPMQQILSQENANGLYEYAMYFQQIGDTNQEIYGPAMSNSDDQIRIFDSNGVHQKIYTGVPSPFDQKWHQLVVVYDINDVNYGPSPSVTVLLYGDGQLIASFFDPNGSLGPELSHIMLGAENDIGNSYNVLGSYMDEFAIYAGVLGPDRVLAHYTAWQPKSCADMQARGLGLPGDMTGNCKIDFADFASFASQWRLCNDPKDPKCSPNW